MSDTSLAAGAPTHAKVRLPASIVIGRGAVGEMGYERRDTRVGDTGYGGDLAASGAVSATTSISCTERRNADTQFTSRPSRVTMGPIPMPARKVTGGVVTKSGHTAPLAGADANDHRTPVTDPDSTSTQGP